MILRLIRIFIFFLLSIYILGELNLVSADTNLAPNPSFEEGENIPNGWKTVNSTGCTDSSIPSPLNFEWSNNTSKSGSHSVGLTDINWNQNISSIPGSWLSTDFITILPFPQEYEISTLHFANNPNVNIGPRLIVCEYDINGNFLGSTGGGTQFPTNEGQWFSHTVKLDFRDSRVAKIKVSLGAQCFYFFPYHLPCTGSLWFDDMVVRPIGKIRVHKFEDIDRNGIQDQNEPNLAAWRFQIFRNFNCEGQWFQENPTNTNGDALIPNPAGGLPLGNYSILETFIYIERDPVTGRLRQVDGRQLGWVNTTPICQNITLKELETPTANFGNVQGPTFPYFSQKDPQWAQNEYDSANTFGPFFCGTTMAGCGCATTSAAMILKFHGVDKSPSGQPTTPQTLNDWLKANNGYAFGTVKWNSIASYAFKANQNFGTQKIKFSGVGPPNDFTLLQSDLSNGKPPILQQPGHFIVATGTQGTTYSINDPAFQTKTTLAAYNNQFQSMRRFEKTSTDLSALYLTTPAPSELFLTDSHGRRVGKDPQTGIIYTEIPNSFYFLESAFANQSQADPILPSENKGVNTLVILTPQQEELNVQAFGPTNHEIDFSAYDRNGDIQNQTLNTNGSSFEVNYSPEPGSIFEVFQNVEIDIKPGSDQNPINLKSSGLIPVGILTAEDFNAQNVDLLSVVFGPNKINEFHNKGYFEDVDSDGDLDLLMHFKVNMAGIKPEDSQACIFGTTYNGIQVRGCDRIRLVP